MCVSVKHKLYSKHRASHLGQKIKKKGKKLFHTTLDLTSKIRFTLWSDLQDLSYLNWGVCFWMICFHFCSFQRTLDLGRDNKKMLLIPFREVTAYLPQVAFEIWGKNSVLWSCSLHFTEWIYMHGKNSACLFDHSSLTELVWDFKVIQYSYLFILFYFSKNYRKLYLK